ncbi:MAG: hypothetical protein LBN06_00070 [Prevotellaceae bacterium]|jgi:RHS repeat-associated protein|nr:hypothetical protein [Prevotellaceae bacterium]
MPIPTDQAGRLLTTKQYAYDKNGNLKTDLNKGISSNITYNSINLPRTLKFGNTSNPPTNTYTYTADGRLVTAARESATTQYAGHMIYEGTTLKRILVDGGYIEGSTYYYYLTDHLGNNRVVANASGKEFDKERSLNWSDFEARQYMNDVPRFTTMDPLAEGYYSYSPYAYCLGNPLKYIDLKGDSVRVYTETNSYGHAWMSVGEGGDMVVYSYGRFNGTNKGRQGINSSNGISRGWLSQNLLLQCLSSLLRVLIPLSRNQLYAHV